MRSILKAQEVYQLANGKRTFKIEELDIDFPYVKREDHSTYGQKYHLDDHRYLLIYDSVNSLVFGDSKLNYGIRLEHNGTGICSVDENTSELGIKLCKSLGKLKEGSTTTYEF